MSNSRIDEVDKTIEEIYEKDKVALTVMFQPLLSNTKIYQLNKLGA